ncbi:hypothetical protein DY000_02051513 [Brassica cretica]|uniref:Uncharacterized protein n=1 Tax=Brassica cretica TaxID=69181 RepID=A0ABQ7F6Q2_BRACR|nr:hypothetical protein DY000_02051513 [Brassica cretica]
MDRPPSYPHYQNPNPNFFHRAPPLNPNPNFFLRPPPPPPPLQSPNTYFIPPSPPPIRELSGTLSSLQCLISECQRTLDSLSQNLSLEHSSLLHKDGLLPSDVCAMKSEIGGWRDYPISYSYSVLCSILGSEAVEISELRAWILVNSTRYGVVIDTYMSDHVLLLFRLSMKAVVKEAIVFMRESDANAAGEQSCKSRTFECPVLFRVLSWLASQLGVLYGEGNGKFFFALDMLKQCIEVSASQVMLFRSPDSSGVLKDLDEDVKIGKILDSGQVISVSRVAAAVAALYERSMLEGK